MSSQRPQGRPPTLVDVARRAGVSQPTASRVLNGSARKVGENYRGRVLAAAKELGYSANPWAQAMAQGSSRTITLIGSDIAGEFFSSLAGEFIRTAGRLGLAVSIAVTGRRPERELQIARELRALQSRAMVFSGTGFIDPATNSAFVEELDRYVELGGRVVQISRSDLPFETVAFENYAGTYKLASELVRLGYRSPLTLGSGTPLVTMQERVDGLSSGFAAHGFPQSRERILYPRFDWQGAFDTISTISAERLREVDVIFAITDEMALGAIAALRERGVSVPREIAVAGFNDVATLRDTSPPLTTVHVPLDTVADAVLQRIMSSTRFENSPVITTYPVIRESTPPRPLG